MKKTLSCVAFFVLILTFQSCDAISSAISNPPGNVQTGFGGNYSNQGDPNRAGIYSINISQSNGELSGTATYEKGNGESSGVLSVTGNVNGNVANLAFYDQNGNVIARGVLSHNNDQYSFIQNTSSDWIPREALMDRY